MEVDERLRAVPTEGSTTPRADDEGKYVYCIIEADGQQTFPDSESLPFSFMAQAAPHAGMSEPPVGVQTLKTLCSREL